MNKISVFFLLISFSMNSYSYLDPGTGSLIIQSLIAAIAGGMYVIKIYWYRITTFFKKSDKEKDSDIDTAEKKNDGGE